MARVETEIKKRMNDGNYWSGWSYWDVWWLFFLVLLILLLFLIPFMYWKRAKRVRPLNKNRYSTRPADIVFD